MARQGESFDSMLKRFKKAVEQAGIIAEVRKREYYEKPSVKRRRKRAAAIKRIMKKQRKMELYNNRNKFNKEKIFRQQRPPQAQDQQKPTQPKK